MSEIILSLISLLFLGKILKISESLKLTYILLPRLSVKSIVSFDLNSQGLVLKAYGIEVKAPTGHKSITFPEISELNILEIYPPISVDTPLFKVPK